MLSDPTAALGLTDAEAQVRLRTEGFNDLPRAGHRTTLRIVGEVLREPMFALLLGAGVIYLILGDRTEAAVLLAFATGSILITVVQETRSERVLEALRDMTSPRALVIRGGCASGSRDARSFAAMPSSFWKVTVRRPTPFSPPPTICWSTNRC